MQTSNYRVLSCINYFNDGPDWDNATVWDEGYTLVQAQEMVEHLNERNNGCYCYKIG